MKSTLRVGETAVAVGGFHFAFCKANVRIGEKKEEAA